MKLDRLFLIKIMSSRQKSEKPDRFAKLREMRENRQTNLQNYKVDDDVRIFDMVPEDEFNSIAKRLMLEDDFVVDDNGEGYAVGGLEDWDTRHSSQDEEDEEEATDGQSNES